jgi:hypothetical protein
VSDQKLREKRIMEMKNILINLNYPKLIINNAIHKNSNPQIKKKREGPTIIPFIKKTSFPSIFNRNIFNLFNILKTNDTIWKNSKIQNIYKRPTNILNFLHVKKRISRVSKCSKDRCRSCSHLVEYIDQIKIINHWIKLNHNSNCESTYTIYALFCEGCQEVYIGKAQTKLRQRINLHRHHLNAPTNELTLPVTRHLKTCSPHNFKITIIHNLSNKKPMLLCLAEQYFIKLIKPKLNFNLF